MNRREMGEELRQSFIDAWQKMSGSEPNADEFKALSNLSDLMLAGFLGMERFAARLGIDETVSMVGMCSTLAIRGVQRDMLDYVTTLLNYLMAGAYCKGYEVGKRHAGMLGKEWVVAEPNGQP